MKKSFILIALLFLTQPAFADGDAAKGEAIYKSRCGMCHSPDRNRAGPQSGGVVGRTAGSLPDYTYSSALKASGIVWNEKTLDQWLTGPADLVPGTKMAIKVKDPQDRADVIAYLKSISPQ
jgi:cytochrome c